MLQQLHLRLSFAVLLMVGLLSQVMTVSAQRTGYIQVNGKVRKDGKPMVGVVIQISAPGAPSQTVSSKDNGSFNINLDLQKDYVISFTKPGLVTKTVGFNTIVPPDQSDIIYQNEFNVDLFDDVGDVSQNSAMNKAVARISYNPTYEDFVHDANYTKQIQSEQDLALKQAEEIQHRKDRARLDSLNRIWSDSLAREKQKEAGLLAQQAEQQRLRDAREKARQDSVNKAMAEAQAAAMAQSREKSRLDSIQRANENARLLAESQEKARKDSVLKAEAEQARLAAISKSKAEAEARARDKFQQDSLVRATEKSRALAEARDKAYKDSLARSEAEQARLAELAKFKAEADAKAREKARQDSSAKALALESARQKAISDSIKQADADAKEKVMLAAKAKEDAEKKLIADKEASRLAALAEAARRDSLNKALEERNKAEMLAKMNAQKAAKDKEEEDRKNKMAADKAQKDSAALALRLQKEKEEQDRQAKAYAEIEAKKKLLAKSAETKDSKTKSATPSVAIPKIRDSDYRDGITDEKVEEPNRIIYRTVVKKDGFATNYQKLVYNWGGVFFFRNESSITQNLFEQEIKNAKDTSLQGK